MAVQAMCNWEFGSDGNGGLHIDLDVFFVGSSVAGGTAVSSLVIPVTAGQTANQVGAAILSAIDAEATRMGSAVGGTPTNVYGPTVGKLR